MQGVNLSLAIAALEASGALRDGSEVPAAIAGATAPGRFQFHAAFGRNWILDGAHNVSAVIPLVRSLFEADLQREATEQGRPPFALVAPVERPVFDGVGEPPDRAGFEEWKRSHRRFILVSAMLEGHEATPFYSALAPICRSLHVPPIDFHRSRRPAEIVAEVGHLFPIARMHDRVEQAIAAAIEESDADTTVLVTGSFYLVGAVGRIIGADRRQRS